MILLGKNPGLVQKQTNVMVEEENEFLLTLALKKAKIQCDTVPQPHLESVVEDTGSDISLASSSSSSTTSATNLPEKDGLIYIAGYLAKKFKEKYPTLGEYSYKTKEYFHTYCMPSWVQHLLFGGLIEPSDQWKDQVFEWSTILKKSMKINFPLRNALFRKQLSKLKKSQ